MSQNTATPNGGLRILSDFDHRRNTSTAVSPREHYRRLIETETALEAVAVMLQELECRQIRADYIACLIEPHVQRLKEATTGLCDHIADLPDADLLRWPDAGEGVRP